MTVVMKKASNKWPCSDRAIPPLGINPWENRAADKDFSSRVTITLCTIAKKKKKKKKKKKEERKRKKKKLKCLTV